MSDGVFIAVITGGFGLLGAMLEFARRQNAADHGEVSKSLGRIETKIDTHINDHAKGEFE